MGVYVLGMHRSGTSAVTRVVNLLGVPIGREDRLMPAQPDNPAGFWEHLALMDVNDAVLERLGGAWDAPTEPDPTFATSDVFADLRGRARAEFDATYDGDRWVFKDPRVSVLLPFWRAVLGEPHAVVIVLRNPLDIAASLARRERFPVVLTLAIWERYMRLVQRDTLGASAFVLDFDSLLDEPTAVVGRLQEFLAQHDQVAAAPQLEAVHASLVGSLRHTRHTDDEFDADPRVTDEQRALYHGASKFVGVHDALDFGPLPAESITTQPLLAAHRAPGSPELRAIDALGRQLGAAEFRLADVERELGDARGTIDAVDAALGHHEIGRLERAALGAARRARRVQQRLGKLKR